MENTIDYKEGLAQAWTHFMLFVPRLLLAIIILIAGYFLAKLACRLLHRVLARVGFDRLVERGGIKRTLARTRYDASDLLARLLFYTIMLFVLQLGFGVFGPNPITALLTTVIGFLPNLFAAVLIIIVASAVAAATKDILQAALAGLSYGRFLSNLAAGLIVATGVFAALNQVNIAPAIVNGLFYALLAIVAGSAIVAIGGGGIVPMRAQWEKMLARIERDAPRMRKGPGEAASPGDERSETWKEEAQTNAPAKTEVRSFPQ